MIRSVEIESFKCLEHFSVEDLGKGIPEALCLAREAGFEALTLFEKREPRRLKIT